MKKIIVFLIFPALLFGQQKMILHDFDGDLIQDKVYIEPGVDILIYELSSQNFKKVKTDEFVDNGTISLTQKKDGFKVNISQMRAGNSYQFRYEKETKKMRLIGMWRTEFGPANNDGSGESSVNLLTNTYVGEWNYFDVEEQELIKIPSIKKKMVLPKTYLNHIGDVFSTYMEKDVSYYLAEKKRLYRTEK